MAGIKFTIDDKINPDAYISFIEELFLDDGDGTPKFEQIGSWGSEEVSDNMIEFIRDGNRHKPAENKLVTIKDQPPRRRLNKGTAKLKVTYDDDVENGRGKRKFIINLPQEIPDNPSSLDYLQPYLAALKEVMGGETEDELVRARKFLFGVMLLTRCR